MQVKIGELDIELRVDDDMAPSVLRAFAGRTKLDCEVDAMDIPVKPLWLNLCLRALRTYRKTRPAQIGQRCVCDPSCSRYAELAFRKLGFFAGLAATVGRLRRCRPGHGGLDIP